MAKHGISGRVRQLARANIGVMVDSAADPGQLIGQLLLDYTANISAAEQAIAEFAGSLRMMEDDQAQDARAAGQWSGKAEAASRRADELRAGGGAAEADRFDDLARAALERQLIAERDIRAGQHAIDAQSEAFESLRTGLDQMIIRLSELRQRQDSLVSRVPGGPAQAGLPGMSTTADVMDPASEIAGFDERVRQEEARVRGREERPASSLDAQFAVAGDLADRTEIEERLQELKADRAMASATARAHDQATT